MKRTELVLQLSIPVDLWTEGPGDPDIDPLKHAAEQLEQSGYDEGRYPFDREMATHALSRMIRSAVWSSVRAQMREKWGDHMTEMDDGRTRVSTMYIKADEWMANVLKSCDVSPEEWSVEIKEWPERCRT